MYGYSFTIEDFNKAFEFAVNYYLDPTKSSSGRTSSEPRGLGAVIDAFTVGKLAEIGVEKILLNNNPLKEYNLDFEIKKMIDIIDEPDIISIKENNEIREPNLFIEIKNTSQNDRWLGLTEEQLSTIKNASGEKNIFIIYVRLLVDSEATNSRQNDIVGMYLKEISQLSTFSDFSSLNLSVSLEYIISIDELENFGFQFKQGNYFYETNLFGKAPSLTKNDGTLKSKIVLKSKYINFDDYLTLTRIDGTIVEDVGCFKINGGFKIYEKLNEKTRPMFIECLKKTTIENDIFGKFILEPGKIYYFNLDTLGRDPILKRNNLWISKKRLLELIDKGEIPTAITTIKDIANGI